MKIQLELKRGQGSSTFVYFDSEKPEDFDPTSLIIEKIDRYNELNQHSFFFRPWAYPRSVKAREYSDCQVKRGGWKGTYEKGFIRLGFHSGRKAEKIWYDLKKVVVNKENLRRALLKRRKYIGKKKRLTDLVLSEMVQIDRKLKNL